MGATPTRGDAGGGAAEYVLGKRGELTVAAAYVCAVATLIAAYAHPTRPVLVTVNQFSEADTEMALLLLSLPAASRFLAEGLLRDGDAPLAAPRNPAGVSRWPPRRRPR